MALDFHRIWIEQCVAAEAIREDLGVQKSLGYLIGEKLLNFLQASDTSAEFARELPSFIARIREIFEPWEISEYSDGVNRVGALGHVCSDAEHDLLRKHGAVEDDPVSGAEDVILLERARELLLSDA